MKKKRFIISLTLMLCLLLSACGEGPSPVPAEEVPEAPEDLGEYQFSRERLPGKMSLSVSQYAVGDTLYLCGMDNSSRPLLYRYDQGELFSYPVPDDISYLYACCKTDEGLAVLAGDYPSYWKNAQGIDVENRKDQYALYLLLYDSSGQVAMSSPVCLPDSKGETYFSLLYSDGFYYLMNSAELLQLSDDGELLNKRTLEGGLFHSQAVSEQGLTIALYSSVQDGGDEKAHIERLVSPEKFTFETLYADTDYLLGGIGFDGNGKQLFLLDGSLFLHSSGDQDVQEVFNFRRAGVYAVPYTAIFPTEQGLFLAGRNLTVLDRLDFGEPPEVEELVLWAPYEDPLTRNLVSSFNVSNNRYRISIVYVDPDDASLQAKIAAGEGPDLFLTGTSSIFNHYQGNSIFVDLLPYLDQSAVIGRDSMPPAVLDAMLLDGKLYSLPVTLEFNFIGCLSRDLADNKISLTDAFYLPEVQDGSTLLFRPDANRRYVWKLLCSLYQVDHVDPSQGTCDFDTPEYADLLRCCLLAHDDELYHPEDEGKPYLFSPSSCPGLLNLIARQQMWEEDFSLAYGMGTGLSIPVAFSISQMSDHKDAAWVFLEYVFTQDLPDDPGFIFPASNIVFNRLIEQTVTTGLWYAPTKTYISPSEYSLGVLQEMLSPPLALMDRFPELTQIMDEEAAKFFVGDCTAEEAARATQARAAIFMAERFG
ncbi:MAG: hypothetical protein IJK63_12235 [Oscillospiraceae bacterium]|nr:hypothetical protein [Oscillospiraceae bacterium]